MFGGADESEPEDHPSTRTTTPPSTPSPPPPPLPPPIASPSSPLQQTAGVGLGRRLFGSIRSLLPASPRAATPAPKLGLGLLLHLRPDHPSLHPTPTLPASTSPSASEDDPLEEDAAAARPHAAVARGDGGLDAAAGLHSPAHTGGDVALEGDQEAGLVDGQQGAGPAANEIRAGDESRPTDVASPSASEEDEARATGVSSASEDDEPEEGGSLNAAEWLRAAELNAGAGLHLPPVNVRCGFGEDGAATTTAPPNIMFRPAAEMGGKLALEEDQESGLALVDGHGHGQEGTIHTQAAAPAKGDDQFCASDESGASEEEDLLGEKEKVVEQQGAADRQGALVKDVDAAGDDQEKVLQQCAGDQLRAARDDQEVGEQDDIHPRDETTCDIAAAEDQEKVGSAENVDVVEGQEVVEQDGIHQRDATIYYIAVEEQEKVEGHSTEQCGSTGNNDDAVEDQEVLLPDVIDRKGQGTDGTAIDDQDKAVQQCDTYDLGTTENDDDDDDAEAVGQGVCDEGGMDADNAVKNHEVAGLSVIDRMHATIDATGVEDQDKGVNATYDLGTVENDDVMDDQEVVEQDTTHPMDDNAVEEEERLERHATHALGSTENVDDAVEDQEVVEQCVIDRTAENDDAMDDQEVVERDTTHSMDDIAVEEEEKLEQHATHRMGMGSTKNVDDVEDQEVVEQCVIGTVENDDVMDDQEVVQKETTHSMDDIAVEEEEKLERHATHRMGSTKNVDDVEDQEVVEQCVIGTVENDDVMDDEEVVEQDTTHPMDDIAVEEEEKLERHTTHGLGSTENVDDAVDDQEVVEQCVIERTIENDDVMDDQEVVEQDTTHQMVDIAVEEKEKLEGHATHGLGSTENVDDAVEDQEVVDQCVIDRTFENDDVMDDQEAVEKDTTHSMGDIAVEEEKNLERHATHGLANGGHAGIGKKEKVKLPYPQRPGKLNCPFYMSKGTCSYGFSCNFHHPPLKANPDGSWCSSEQGNQGVKEILELNRIGLPIREGARNCTYYMRNGACRYGKHCHFNHPDHVIDAQFYTPTGWEDSPLQLEKSFDRHTTGDDTSHLKKSSDDAIVDDTSYSKKSSDHANLDDTSSSTGVLPPHILRMLLPPQKIPATTEAKVIPVKKDSNWSSTSDDSDGCCSADSSDGPLCKQENVDSSDRSLCKQEHVDYPERPGRPECPFYMRFGDCKFASRCKYHHTIDKRPTRYHPEVPSLGGEQTEYPERPGEPECPFYMKAQFCKFGAQCKFNHPKDSNPTLQGPTDAKKSVAANEHQPTRITLEDHMPQQQQHPERPGQPDCRYYLQFGECKFLSACIFNHPRDVPPSGPAHSDQIEPDMHDMPECPFYMKSGKCQFGSACKFRHPKDICSTTEGAFGHRTGSAYDNFTRPGNVVQQREQIAYPERPGEPECFQYMRHGSCRFQMNCRYHHPADRLSRKQYDSTHH